MSYELYIYSLQETTISRVELRRAMRDLGWVTRILPSGSFIGSKPFELLPDNAPLDNCLLAESGMPTGRLEKRLCNSINSAPDEGEDGDLYGGFGYVHKSQRKSGLTRKKKENPL